MWWEMLIKLPANDTFEQAVCPRVISLYDVSHSISHSGLVSNSRAAIEIPL